MKTQLSIIALLALSVGACNSDTTTTTTSTDTAAAVAPAADPNMVTTTTTTTTTRPAYVPKPDVKYLDLRTKKMVTVRVDTVHHYIVNTVTNQPVEWIVEPGTNDTVYGRNMMIANGLINYGTSGNWTFDESLANQGSTSSSSSMTTTDSMAPAEGKEIRKQKISGHETKTKYMDHSKEKVTPSETKIKNR